ncbi:MAG: AAA family ATPase [Candidatus Paceibacterota bacterium]|nr:AAA family ATPase [Candidatus Paceibacterota bacterium]
MVNKIILAVVGLPGAGKTEAVEYLIKKTSWPKVYLGDATFEEMKNQCLEVNEANERKIREEIRKKLGMSAYAILNLPKVRELAQTSNVLIESLYSWEEYLEFKKEFGDSFKVLAIYSSPDKRIERLENRPCRPLKKEDVISRDYSQIENTHQAGPIARSDFTIINEEEKENLYSEIDRIILGLK